jgi:hypothetical protein
METILFVEAVVAGFVSGMVGLIIVVLCIGVAFVGAQQYFERRKLLRTERQRPSYSAAAYSLNKLGALLSSAWYKLDVGEMSSHQMELFVRSLQERIDFLRMDHKLLALLALDEMRRNPTGYRALPDLAWHCARGDIPYEKLDTDEQELKQLRIQHHSEMARKIVCRIHSYMEKYSDDQVAENAAYIRVLLKESGLRPEEVGTSEEELQHWELNVSDYPTLEAKALRNYRKRFSTAGILRHELQ